ncbi:MAG TPA: hypothetical protein VLZ77_11365 [Acidimicrobiales bacterium]|nr:hypothetical protein [Acidimicrobiales bacterium]
METHIDLFDGPSWDESEPKGYQAAPISRLKGAGEGLLGLGLGLAIPASFALTKPSPRRLGDRRPAMAAGVETHPWSTFQIAALLA